MPTISVVTAVHPPNLEYLKDAYTSLVDQALPPDWEWQWIVQLDGTDIADVEHAQSVLPDDPRISFGCSRKNGPAIARTISLARCTGSFVRVLDSDDQLAHGALARDIFALSQSGVGWTTSRVIDISPDGQQQPHFSDDPRNGRLKAGTIYARWRKIALEGNIQENHARSMTVHPATLCIRYWLLLALGGWMALPASEDTGLLLALDAVSDGWFTEETGLFYRKWPGQLSAAPDHMDSAELLDRRALIELRADCLGQLIDGW